MISSRAGAFFQVLRLCTNTVGVNAVLLLVLLVRKVLQRSEDYQKMLLNVFNVIFLLAKLETEIPNVGKLNQNYQGVLQTKQHNTLFVFPFKTIYRSIFVCQRDEIIYRAFQIC